MSGVCGLWCVCECDVCVSMVCVCECGVSVSMVHVCVSVWCVFGVCEHAYMNICEYLPTVSW